MSKIATTKHSLPVIQESWFDIFIVISLICACIVWSVVAGKDQNWDQLQYHFYLPYSLIEDRLGKDFLPASGQSYLNPFAYIPFYWMVMHQWNSLLIASVLATFHSMNAVLSYFIAKKLQPLEYNNRRYVAAFAALLAFLCPVFLAEVGTTYADITTSVLVLAAVLCALQSDQIRPVWKDCATFCGLLMGAAGALKLSNLVFGPACALLLLIMQPSFRRQAKALLLMAAGSMIGFLAGHGYWGWKLWSEFRYLHHPIFETFINPNVLEKAGAPSERFLPSDLVDALLIPFRMIELRSWIYTETILPDLRILALVILALVGGTYLLLRHKNNTNFKSILTRQFVALFAFFILAFGLWQWTSGNGRYGLAILVLAGPLLAVTVCVVFRGNVATYHVLGILALAQVLHFQGASGLRFSAVPWTASWYPLSVPEHLKHEPYLYLSVGPAANSYIYPLLSKDSAFANPIGQISVDTYGVGGQQMRRLLEKYRGRIRIIAAADTMTGSTSDAEKLKSRWVIMNDSFVSRFGYSVNVNDCEMIEMASSSIPSALTTGSRQSDPSARSIRTCGLIERPFADDKERERMTKIMKEVVAWCPKLFKPSHTVVDRILGGWQSAYPSTDSLLIIVDQQIVGLQTGAWVDLLFGTVTQWEQGIRPSCANFPDNPRKVYNFN